MSPASHFLAGWLVANALPRFDRRWYALIVGAGLIPDADGLGYPVELLTRDMAHPLTWYADFHHVLVHGIAGLVLVAALTAWWSRVGVVVALAIASFLLHLLLDLAGSAGPEGEIWPIVPFWPFSAWEFSVPWQWPLNSWQNTVLTAAFEVAVIWLAVRRRFSPFRLFSDRLDDLVVRRRRD